MRAPRTFVRCALARLVLLAPLDSTLPPSLSIQALPHAVYGVAIATMDGIRAVLTATGAGAGERQRAPVRWYNLREEGVVFINGTPFVLREATRPLANLLECAHAWGPARACRRLR